MRARIEKFFFVNHFHRNAGWDIRRVTSCGLNRVVLRVRSGVGREYTLYVRAVRFPLENPPSLCLEETPRDITAKPMNARRHFTNWNYLVLSRLRLYFWREKSLLFSYGTR